MSRIYSGADLDEQIGHLLTAIGTDPTHLSAQDTSRLETLHKRVDGVVQRNVNCPIRQGRNRGQQTQETPKAPS